MDEFLLLVAVILAVAAFSSTIYIHIAFRRRDSFLTGFNNLLEASTVHLLSLIRRLEGRVDCLSKDVQKLSIDRGKLSLELEAQGRLLEEVKEDLKPLMRTYIKLSQGFRGLHEKLSNLEKQLSLQQAALKTQHRERPAEDREVSFARLTPTEMEVLRLLYVSGPKTASEIREVINRTREHTARLMKKLYLEGYVERDTTTTPYIYKLSSKIRKSLEFSMKKPREEA